MKTELRLLLCLAIFTMMGSAVAQDDMLTVDYAFDSGHIFSYPDDWHVVNETESTATLTSDLTQITLVDSAYFEDAGVAASGLNKSLSWYFETYYQGGLDFDAGAVEEFEIGERSALHYDYEDTSNNDAVMIGLQFSDETFGIVAAVSLDGALQEEDLVLAIAESFDVGTAELHLGGQGQVTITSAAEACTVSTDQSRTVHVHVGPGENRTSYTFLPANVDFEVLGQATAADDSLWWKLDREAVAPDAAAEEAWVAQEAVQASGDCDSVLDVNAPPIIPIVSEPPPEPTASSSDSGGEQPPADTGTTPTPGSWTISYANSAPGSCLGSQTIHVPIDFASETYSLSVSSSAIVYGGDRLALRQPGVYGGLFDIGSISAEIILRVRSSTLMTGEIIFTEVFNDTACSISLPVTVTRN